MITKKVEFIVSKKVSQGVIMDKVIAPYLNGNGDTEYIHQYLIQNEKGFLTLILPTELNRIIE